VIRDLTTITEFHCISAELGAELLMPVQPPAHGQHQQKTPGRDVWDFLEQAWIAHQRSGVMPSQLNH
jgi:hypothetical protein